MYDVRAVCLFMNAFCNLFLNVLSLTNWYDVHCELSHTGNTEKIIFCDSKSRCELVDMLVSDVISIVKRGLLCTTFKGVKMFELCCNI